MFKIWSVIAFVVTAILATNAGRAAEVFATPELVAQAEAEGNLVLYSGELLEDEMAQINAFKAKFPKIKVELVRQTSQKLVPIIEAEISTNKLRADIIDLTDWGTAVRFADQFAEYAPPNASEFKSVGQNLGKLWPRFTFTAVIVYNTALVEKIRRKIGRTLSIQNTRESSRSLSLGPAGRLGAVSCSNARNSGWTIGPSRRR